MTDFSKIDRWLVQIGDIQITAERGDVWMRMKQLIEEDGSVQPGFFARIAPDEARKRAQLLLDAADDADRLLRTPTPAPEAITPSHPTLRS